MTLGDAVDALVLGIVEGLTEFVPVSSTGHQIVVADLLNFRGDFAIAFNVIIQLGAILAVVWEYRGKIVHVVAGLPSDREAQRFTRNLLIAFFPAFWAYHGAIDGCHWSDVPIRAPHPPAPPHQAPPAATRGVL